MMAFSIFMRKEKEKDNFGPKGNIIQIMGEKDTYQADINGDGKLETIIIERNSDIPEAVDRLVVLDNEGNILLYKSRLGLYYGWEHLKEYRKPLDRYYKGIFGDNLGQDYIEQQRIIRSIKPLGVELSGIPGLTEFEREVAEVWLKRRRINMKQGSPKLIAKYDQIFTCKINVFRDRYYHNWDFYITSLDRNGKDVWGEGTSILWNPEVKSYMSFKDFMRSRHPDYPF